MESDEEQLSQCVVTLKRTHQRRTLRFTQSSDDAVSIGASSDRTNINPVTFTSSPKGLGPSQRGVKRKRSKSENRKKDTPEKAANPREAYLITYSQADVVKVPGRDKFAEMIVNEFNRNDDVTEKWVVSAELHRNKGIHYHMALKLKTQRRFKAVRNNIYRRYGIHVDFKEWHTNYFDAFQYVTKFDSHYVVSPGHTVLVNPPRTTKATEARRASSSSEPPSKKARATVTVKLNREDVGNIVRENSIKTIKALFRLARAQAREGKTDLRGYLYRHPNQTYLGHLISTVVGIEVSEEESIRENLSRLEILNQAKREQCVQHPVTKAPCDGLWLQSALEVLEKNGISRRRFARIILNSLFYGRCKGRNVMICGETNCAKSFMLMPLTKIFRCFMTPSPGSYNWVDAPDKEIIFLNDLRYEKDGEKKVMSWNLFLNLLEGAPINVAMPKNHYTKDLVWTKTQPIIATAEKAIVRIVNGQLDKGETDQMKQRWTVINFKYRFQEDEVNYDITPCGACFAKLLLDA